MNIDAETLICASLGKPNRASMAPILHNAGIKALGINYTFVVFEPDDIGEAMNAVRAFKLPGVSVTSPYKQAVLQYLDNIDPTARAIGAVNAIQNKSGRLTGYNCDWIGAIEALEEVTKVAGMRIAVLGAGGAARAVIFGLLKKSAEVTMYNRTIDRGQSLADEMGIKFGGDLPEVGNSKPDILVNATRIGMGDGGFVQVDESVFDTARIVMDVVTKPRRTSLLNAAAAHGCTVIEGSRMLVLQGVFAFELFTGHKAPIEAMYDAVAAELR